MNTPKTSIYLLDSQKPKGYEIVPGMTRAFSLTVEGPRVQVLEYVGALTSDDARALAEALEIAAKLAEGSLDLLVPTDAGDETTTETEA